MLLSLVVLVASSAPALNPVDQPSREYLELKEQRPNLAGSFVSLGFGLASIVPGIFLLQSGIRGGWEGPDTLAISLGLVLLVPGVIGAVIGLVKLWFDMQKRNAIDERLLELDPAAPWAG